MKNDRLLWSILTLGIGVQVLLTPYDRLLTRYLSALDYPAFVRFMDQSAFEGEPLGGGDLPMLIFFVLVFLYLFSPRIPALRPYHNYLGYIVLSGLSFSVYLVHTLKWLTGRPRPHRVLGGELPFSEWFTFGAHFVSEGGYRGSFPSGHTASALLIVPLLYVGWALARNRGQCIGMLVLTLVTLGQGILMGVSRAMKGAHWITDVWFILFAAFLISHLFFVYGMRLQDPAQASRPPFYALRIAFFVLVISLGVFFFGMGVRALLREELLVLSAGIPPGLVLAWWGRRACLRAGFYVSRRCVS